MDDNSEASKVISIYTEIRTFVGLSLIVFWLTSFPLRGFLSPSKEWTQIFLITHAVTYLCIYVFFSLLEKYGIFGLRRILAFKTGLLTILFPFVSDVLVKMLIGIILAVISPFIVLEILKQMKEAKDRYWIYTGFIIGNLATLGLQKSLTSPQIAFFILGLSVLGVGELLNYRVKQHGEPQEGQKEQKQKTQNGKILTWLILGIGIFYLCGDLAYRWLEERSVKINYVSVLLILSYGTGILLGITFRKKNWWGFRGLFVLGATTLFISKLFLHFKISWTLLGANVFLLFSIGLMDFLTLNYFITRFERIRELALLYAIITFSLFFGYILFESVLLRKEEYMLSFLSVISLSTILLFFYKIPLEKDLEKEITITEVSEEDVHETEERLTPQILMEKINSSLPSYAKGLTKRESEVLFYYVIEDKNLKEISEILGISRSSVREYLKRTSLKLEVSTGELKAFVKNFLKNT